MRRGIISKRNRKRMVYWNNKDNHDKIQRRVPYHIPDIARRRKPYTPPPLFRLRIYLFCMLCRAPVLCSTHTFQSRNRYRRSLNCRFDIFRAYTAHTYLLQCNFVPNPRNRACTLTLLRHQYNTPCCTRCIRPGRPRVAPIHLGTACTRASQARLRICPGHKHRTYCIVLKCLMHCQSHTFCTQTDRPRRCSALECTAYTMTRCLMFRYRC